jgi:hypothetical protein
MLSLPAGTKMFQFPAYPTGKPVKSGIPGSKAVCASPGLIAADHALHRIPSQAVHQMVYQRSSKPTLLLHLSSFPFTHSIIAMTAARSAAALLSASDGQFPAHPHPTFIHKDEHKVMVDPLGPSQIRTVERGARMPCFSASR